MDYEKEYNEALERAMTQIKECGDNEGRKRMIYSIFPQLCECEEETKSAIDLIAEERERQISKGFNWRHDDEHDCHQLSDAAIVYAAPAPLRYQVMNWWPWDKKGLKEDDSFTTEGRIGELVKAGALIVAEIERLQRMMNNVTKPIVGEDERINKAIFKALSKKDARDVLLAEGVQVSDALAYLEKQKEENHDGKKWIYEDDYHKDMERCFNDGKDEVLENPEKYGLQQEQKPNIVPRTIRPKFAVGDTVCRNMWSDCTIQEIYIYFDDPVYICVNEEGTESHIPFSEQDEWDRKEQKPAEWSEEDEKFFITALWHISYSVSNGKSTDCHCDTTDWLKSIKERIKSLCPSWKPSMEQISMVTCVCNNLHMQNSPDAEGMDELLKQLEKLYWNTPDVEEKKTRKPRELSMVEDGS